MPDASRERIASSTEAPDSRIRLTPTIPRCACKRTVCWHEISYLSGCPSRVPEAGLICGLCRSRD